jgi:hypothetical protein
MLATQSCLRAPFMAALVGIFASAVPGCKSDKPVPVDASVDAGAKVQAVLPYRGPTRPSKEGEAPFPVVVTIVVDQLAAWIMSERLPALSRDGGFHRLAHEGTYVTEMRYAHAVCDTAPGHAALYTGAAPHESGIVANERIDESLARVSTLLDPKTTAVDAQGVRDGEPGSSIASLRVPTLADQLRQQKPDAVIISLSLKDRGAIFGGGRTPTDSVWYDAAKGNFVTSTAFTRTPPPWLAASWKEDHQPYVGKSWDAPLRPEWVKEHTSSIDAQVGEGDYLGLGVAFPHDLRAASSPMKAFRMTPFGDRVLLSMALRAMDERAAGYHPTLVAISLSSNDYIGHVFGPDSMEAWDELDRLDQELAAFFTALDGRFGASGWSAVLSADHGVVPMPEVAADRAMHPYCAHPELDPWKRPCVKGERLLLDKLADELDAVAVKVAGKGKWIAGVADPYIWLTDAARKLAPPKKKEMLAAVKAKLMEHPGVAQVLEPQAFADACPPDEVETQDALLCRAHMKDVGGELYVVTKPGSFFDPNYAEDRGTSHGSDALFDRAVPLFVRPGRSSSRGRVVTAPQSYRSFARSAAALLGIRPPKAAEPGTAF